MHNYKPYKKDDQHSYALGLFPVIELLEHQPKLVKTVLVSNKIKPSTGLSKINALCSQHKLQIKEVEQSVLTRLSRSENTFAAAVFDKQTASLAVDQSHVVLVNPDDMGNLGTIMRTMVGFNVHDLAIITPAADPFDPKTIRASMGAFFSLRIAQFANFEGYAQAHSHYHQYPFVLDGAQKLAQTTFTTPASLIFGQEGSGLPKTFDTVGTTVTIEQSDQVDSLNLALSVGLALYKQFIS
jgi:RNA methyltransferase, TrmH family